MEKRKLKVYRVRLMSMSSSPAGKGKLFALPKKKGVKRRRKKRKSFSITSGTKAVARKIEPYWPTKKGIYD